MVTKETIQKRFDELSTRSVKTNRYDAAFVDAESWGGWSASALNLVQMVFGADSSHYEQLKKIAGQDGTLRYTEYEQALGGFSAAKKDYESGCYTSLNRLVAGEVFGDFIATAKKALEDGNKDAAAVLACAALEDALKRYAKANGLNVDGKDMTEVVNALKSKGLVAGAQKGILDSMPKIRNAAMHADWNKITPVEVGGVIGLTQQFLIENFS